MMERATTKSAQEQLARIRRLIDKSHSPLARMTEQQVIQALRKTREELWEAKVAPRTR